jgi:Dolichyl-phosphate-mannose-protein mannosyltransferase
VIRGHVETLLVPRRASRDADLKVAAIGLGVATILLRLPGALSWSFWQDEVASARVVQQPTFGSMLHQVVRTESTPPLWYALAWALHHAGVSIHDVRLLSVALDGLVVAAIVVLAGRVLPLRLAVAAGAIASVGAQLSAHGRELRAYELLAALVVALAFCLDRAVERPDTRRLALLAATVAAGLLTHYFFAFTLASAVLWVLCEPAARRTRRRVLAALTSGCLLAAPWAPFFLVQFRADRYSWIGPFSTASVLGTPLRLLAPALDSWPSELLLLGWLALAVVVAARCDARTRMNAWLALAPIALAALTWLIGVRVYATRNLIGTVPFIAVLLVVPFTRLRPRASLAAAATFVAVFAVTYGVDQLKPVVPYKQLAAALVADGWRGSGLVAVVGGPHALTSPLEWYLPGAPRFAPLLHLGPSQRQIFAVLGARSPERSAIRDAIRVNGWIVGRLPVGQLHGARTGLTLLAAVPARHTDTRVIAERSVR